MRAEFREETGRLLAWYDRERRILPWREDPAPYHVWLSEIMLQQTRVEAVKGYYLRFLEALPTISALAEAPEDQVLKLWEGLGYYSRARNLQRCARQVMEEYGGSLPSRARDLERLPGIGPYTAAAIASIAFGEPVPAVDGNLCRIYARRTAFPENVKDARYREEIQEWYRARIDEKRPGDCNQALMDLGARVCLPNAAPLCGHCPWGEGEWCLARSRGEEASYPKAAPKKEKPEEELSVFLIRTADEAGETCCLLQKRGGSGLLAGLYEFPNAPGRLGAGEAAVTAQALLDGTGLSMERITPIGEGKHVFTHRVWRMYGFAVEASGPWREDNEKGLLRVTKQALESTYSVPAAFGFVRKAFLES